MRASTTRAKEDNVVTCCRSSSDQSNNNQATELATCNILDLGTLTQYPYWCRALLGGANKERRLFLRRDVLPAEDVTDVPRYLGTYCGICNNPELVHRYFSTYVPRYVHLCYSHYLGIQLANSNAYCV